MSHLPERQEARTTFKMVSDEHSIEECSD